VFVPHTWFGLIGRNVRINRAGPDSVAGRLLGVGEDYLAVRTDEGVVYVASWHVKSVTATDGASSNSSNVASASAGKAPPAATFLELLLRLRRSRIRVNRGPEKVEGLLLDVRGGQLLLARGNEHVHVPLFHVKNVCVLR